MDWKAFTQLIPRAKAQLQELTNIPNRASDIADEAYPDSARDASTKNAYRHALGTGMLTQALGGGTLGAVAAKMAGWGWEAPTLLDPRSTPEQREDSRHDLNANAIGAAMAMQARNQADLETALRSYADVARVGQAPGAFARSPGQMTRTLR